MSNAEGSSLQQKRCLPCEGGIPPLSAVECERLAAQTPKWAILADGKRIRREWKMPDFVTALEWCCTVGDLAEAEGHHPDFHLTNYRQLAIEIWTHAVGGLTENDFILAAKIDALEAAREQ